MVVAVTPRCVVTGLVLLTGAVTLSCGTWLVSGACGPADCCENEIEDGAEVDVDCGYRCNIKCDPGQHCVLDEDCRTSYRCTMERDIEDRICVARHPDPNKR